MTFTYQHPKPTETIYVTSWLHPRSKHSHHLDYDIIYASDRKDVRITLAMHGYVAFDGIIASRNRTRTVALQANIINIQRQAETVQRQILPSPRHKNKAPEISILSSL